MTQSETSKPVTLHTPKQGDILGPWFGRIVSADFQGVLRQHELVRFRLYDESPWLRFQQARQGSE